MPHSHVPSGPPVDSDDPAAKAQQRRALKLMAAVLIPVALATVIGLILAVPVTTAIGVAIVKASHNPGGLEPIAATRRGKSPKTAKRSRSRSDWDWPE